MSNELDLTEYEAQECPTCKATGHRSNRTALVWACNNCGDFFKEIELDDLLAEVKQLRAEVEQRRKELSDTHKYYQGLSNE